MAVIVNDDIKPTAHDRLLVGIFRPSLHKESVHAYKSDLNAAKMDLAYGDLVPALRHARDAHFSSWLAAEDSLFGLGKGQHHYKSLKGLSETWPDSAPRTPLQAYRIRKAQELYRQIITLQRNASPQP